MEYRFIGLGLLCCCSFATFSASEINMPCDQIDADSSFEAYADSSFEAYADSSSESDADSSFEAYADSSSESDADSSFEADADSSFEAYADSSFEAYADSSSDADSSFEADADSSFESTHDVWIDLSADQRLSNTPKVLAAYRLKPFEEERLHDLVELYRLDVDLVSLTGQITFLLDEPFDLGHQIYFSMNENETYRFQAYGNTGYFFEIPRNKPLHLSWAYMSRSDFDDQNELSWIKDLNFFKTEQLSLASFKMNQLSYQIKLK